nr:MFS transporter [Amycolatopsis xylanica]
MLPRAGSPIETAAMRKVTWRVVPLLVLGYFVSYLDRINISFAKFGLEQEFGMSATQYGFAAGIFFVGYILAEVPSNMILAKVGARVWLSRILVTWGLVAAATALAPNLTTVYVLRFLLGVAEAGFFPGILLYLTRWYPTARRTKIVATVMVSIPVASVIGNPVNGWILDTFDGAWGVDGWRWVFILGGVPAVVLGIVGFFALTDRPEKARWLTGPEREWLASTLAAEEAERAASAPRGHWAALKDKRVIALCAVYFFVLCGAYPLTYWMPSVIKGVGRGLSSTQVGWLSAVPFLLSAICMYVTGRLVPPGGSTRPVTVALIISLVTFAGTALLLGVPVAAFAVITVATMAAQTAKPLFWAVPTAYLAGVGAASGLALINSLGNAAGFVSPFAVGWIKDASGGDTGLSMLVMISANVVGLAVLTGLAISARRRGAAGLVGS